MFALSIGYAQNETCISPGRSILLTSWVRRWILWDVNLLGFFVCWEEPQKQDLNPGQCDSKPLVLSSASCCLPDSPWTETHFLSPLSCQLHKSRWVCELCVFDLVHYCSKVYLGYLLLCDREYPKHFSLVPRRAQFLRTLDLFQFRNSIFL